MIFFNCGWCYFNKPYLRAAFDSPWDSRGRTFSDFSKKRKMTKTQGKKRVRNVTGSFHFCETHQHDLKKNRAGIASPRNSTGWTSYKILRKRTFDRYSWFSAQWSILSWLWPDFVTRFGWPSVTCLILVQMPHFFSRLYPVPLALVITTGVVLVFNSAWFSSYKPKSKWTNFLARTVEYRVITISGIGYWLLLVP